MYQADVYKIMIGAPSDIKEEIHIAMNAIYNWNTINSEKQKTVFLPIHWSNAAFPAAGKHPQKIINGQVVAKSDLLICVFGTKLGTPTDSFESGSVEEINEHLEAGKPVMIFFKNAIPSLSDIDPQQLIALNAYKAKLKDNVLYMDYADSSDFEKILDKKLQLAINEHFIKDNQVVRGFHSERISGSENELTVDDIEKLKKWTSVDNPQFFSVFYEGGGAKYGLGASNQYEVKNGREKIEWDDFFEKLIKKGFIEKGYKKDGKPEYILKKAAYNYIDSVSDKHV